MSDKKELNPSPKFPDGEYPKLSPNPNTHDGLVDNTAEKANTQVVNPGQVQEKKDLTVSDIINLIQKFAPQGASGLDSLAPEYDSTATYKAGDMVIHEVALYQAKADIGTAEEWNAEHWDEVNLEEALPKFLKGKYVRIMKAPASATLTEEQFLQLKEGCFINGVFLNYQNPIIMPFTDGRPGTTRGIIFSYLNNAGLYEFAGFSISNNLVVSKSKTLLGMYSSTTGRISIYEKEIPDYPANTDIGHYIWRKGYLQWYKPVVQTGISSGDTIALDSNLGKALLDHLDVEINGFRARYEYTDGNYVVYSSKSEAAGGLKLQVNMISYNTTNGELSFNQMTFTPDN